MRSGSKNNLLNERLTRRNEKNVSFRIRGSLNASGKSVQRELLRQRRSRDLSSRLRHFRMLWQPVASRACTNAPVRLDQNLRTKTI